MEDLFPYQHEGARWLADRRVALLADEMGLGKTAQAITAADDIAAGRLLIICPAIARVNWEREFRKFSWMKRQFQVIETGKVEISTTKSLILSFELAIKLFHEDRFKGHRFDVLIVDEAHYLKSPDARRTKAIIGKKGLVRQAKRFWALSGTPMVNHAGDLWVLLFTFGATRLRYMQFITRFCQFAPMCGPMSGQMKIVGTKKERVQELRALLAPVVKRRLKENVLLELPPIIFGDVSVLPGKVDLSREASFAKWYLPKDESEDLMDELLKQQERLELLMPIGNGDHMTQNNFTVMEALAPSLSTLRRFNGLRKVAPVADMVSWELDQGHYDKVVIFAIHRDVILGLKNRLARYGAMVLYGGTDPVRRVYNIDRFQTKPKCKVAICNIAAAGTAVTFTAAHQVIFVEQEWTPSANAQAAMRVHRIGQTKTVNCRFIGIADSIDEVICGVLRRKTRDIMQVMTGGEVFKHHEYMLDQKRKGE